MTSNFVLLSKCLQCSIQGECEESLEEGLHEKTKINSEAKIKVDIYHSDVCMKITVNKIHFLILV